MEIIIRSRENGWETERRMELPEDAGLVKSILRSVKRRVDPPKLAGGGGDGKPGGRTAGGGITGHCAGAAGPC